MRIFLIVFFLCSTAYALPPIYNTHDNKIKIDEEFTSLYLNAQDKQFEIMNSTPSNEELLDGQIIIFSSDGYVSLQLRVGATNYQIRVSSI